MWKKKNGQRDRFVVAIMPVCIRINKDTVHEFKPFMNGKKVVFHMRAHTSLQIQNTKCYYKFQGWFATSIWNLIS